MISAPIDIWDGASPGDMWENIVDYVAPDLPKLHHAIKYIKAEQQATLFSAPVTLVDGVGGKILLPSHVRVEKAAGTAWTTGSATGVLQVACDSSIYFGLLNQTGTDQFFGSDKAVWVANAGGGQFWSIGSQTGSSSISGASLKLQFASADMSGGTGLMIVNLWYREWDGL